MEQDHGDDRDRPQPGNLRHPVATDVGLEAAPHHRRVRRVCSNTAVRTIMRPHHALVINEA